MGANHCQQVRPLSELTLGERYQYPHSAEWSIGVFRTLRSATKGSTFGNRKPLKRLDPNFTDVVFKFFILKLTTLPKREKMLTFYKLFPVKSSEFMS